MLDDFSTNTESSNRSIATFAWKPSILMSGRRPRYSSSIQPGKSAPARIASGAQPPNRGFTSMTRIRRAGVSMH